MCLAHVRLQGPCADSGSHPAGSLQLSPTSSSEALVKTSVASVVGGVPGVCQFALTVISVSPARSIPKMLIALGSIAQLPCMPVILFRSNWLHILTALVDSVTAGNFISAEVVTQLAIPTKPIILSALDGNQISTAPLLLATEPLILQVAPQHKETISFLMLPSAIHPVVLGLPWLKLHSPTLDWYPS